MKEEFKPATSNDSLDADKIQREAMEHLMEESGVKIEPDLDKQGEAMEHFIKEDEKKTEIIELTGEEKGKKENTPEVEPVNPENENTGEQEEIDPGTNLETAREEYIEQYQEFLKGGEWYKMRRIRNALGMKILDNREIPENIKELKEKYDTEKQSFAQNELEKFETNIEKDISLNPERKKELLENCKNEIFHDFVLDETEHLHKAEIEAFSPFQRGLWMKSYDRWQKMSKLQKLGLSTLMVGGSTAALTLALPVTSSMAALAITTAGAGRVTRGLAGIGASLGVGKLFDSLTANKKSGIEQTTTREVEELYKDFDITKFTEIEEKYKKVFDKKQKRLSNIHFQKAFLMGVTGLGTTAGFASVADAIGSGNAYASDKLSPEVQGGEGGKITMQIPARPEDVTGTEKTVGGVADTIKPKSVDVIKEDYSVQSGDKLINILKKEMPEITELDRLGMKENVVANLLKVIEKNPQDYGITSGNIGSLKIGDSIDMEKISELLKSEEMGGKGLIEHAQGLDTKTLSNIEDPKPEPEIPIEEAKVSPELKTTGEYKISPETTRIIEGNELSKLSDNVRETQIELEEAKAELVEMKKSSQSHLVNNPLGHEELMYSEGNVDAQEKVIADMKEKLIETQKLLGETQTNLGNTLREALANSNYSKVVETYLDLAKISTITDEGNSLAHLNSAVNITDQIDDNSKKLGLLRKILSESMDYKDKSFIGFRGSLLDKIREQQFKINN